MLALEKAISLSFFFVCLSFSELGFFVCLSFSKKNFFFTDGKFFSLRRRAGCPLDKGHSKLECVYLYTVVLHCFLPTLNWNGLISGLNTIKGEIKSHLLLELLGVRRVESVNFLLIFNLVDSR